MIPVVELPLPPPPMTKAEEAEREWTEIDDIARATVLAHETERVLASPEEEMTLIIPRMPYRRQRDDLIPPSISLEGAHAMLSLLRLATTMGGGSSAIGSTRTPGTDSVDTTSRALKGV